MRSYHLCTVCDHVSSCCIAPLGLVLDGKHARGDATGATNAPARERIANTTKVTCRTMALPQAVTLDVGAGLVLSYVCKRRCRRGVCPFGGGRSYRYSEAV